MNKTLIVGALALISVIGAVVLYALDKVEGAALVLNIATGSVLWLQGYATYNPELHKTD